MLTFTLSSLQTWPENFLVFVSTFGFVSNFKQGMSKVTLLTPSRMMPCPVGQVCWYTKVTLNIEVGHLSTPIPGRVWDLASIFFSQFLKMHFNWTSIDFNSILCPFKLPFMYHNFYSLCLPYLSTYSISAFLYDHLKCMHSWKCLPRPSFSIEFFSKKGYSWFVVFGFFWTIRGILWCFLDKIVLRMHM